MKMKRFFSALLVGAVMLSSMVLGVSASEGFTSDTSWYADDKMVDGAYVISTADELYGLSMLVYGGNNFAGKTIKLDADIDLENKEWFPIGTGSAKPFNGIFDGDGHKISNLKLTRPNNGNIGLFGRTNDGEIKNFTVENASVKGYTSVGVVAGCPYTSYYENILVTGDITVEGLAYVGGALGYNLYDSAKNVDVIANEGSYVKADSDIYATYVGAIVGFVAEGTFVIEDCDAEIDVYGSTYGVGGLLGLLHYNDSLINSTFKGDIYMSGENAEYDSMGALVGIVYGNNSNTRITECSATIGKAMAGDADVTKDIYPFGAFWHAEFTENSVFNGANVTINGEYGRFPMGIAVGEYLYGGLAIAAANAAEGATLLFCSDNSYASTLENANNITIDLNGKTLTGDITFAGEGAVTLTNGDIVGNITVNADSTLIIEDVNLNGNITADASDVTINSGYFTSNVAKYCAEGKTILESDVKGYAYMIGDAPEVEVETGVKTEAPAVTVPEEVANTGVTEEKISEAVNTESTNTAISGAAQLASQDKAVVGSESAAVNALTKEEVSVEEATVTVVVKPYIDVKVESASVDAEAPADNTITYEIKAKYDVVATTAENPTAEGAIVTEGEGKNAVVLSEGNTLEMEGKEIELTLPLPTDFTEADTVYVTHTKDDGRVFVYEATVDANGNATFVNPNGFSTFTVSATNPAKATVGGVGYMDFQSAIDAVEAGEGTTITINAAGAYYGVVSGRVPFTLTLEAGVTSATVTLTPKSAGNDFIMWGDGVLEETRVFTLDTSNTTKTVPTVNYKASPFMLFPGALNFETNGGSEIERIVFLLGARVKLEKYVPEREGYTFTGWYADKELTEKIEIARLGGRKHTIYAGWEENK